MGRRRRRHEQPLRFDFAPPPPPPPREARRRRIRWLRFGLVLALLILLAIVSSLFGFMTAVAQNAPNLDQFTAREPAQVGFLYARDPKKPQCDTARAAAKGCWIRIGSLRQGEARQVLTSNQISRPMQDAIVAIEDQRFYQHKGFDPQGIVRAIFNRVALGRNEGGSTITQQLIKNTYLTSEQTIRRKFQEIMLAYQLERAVHSKPKILASYLNTIYFGHGSYGVDAAARYYFGKHASELTVPEAALLAAIPKSPTEFDPILHPQAAADRRALVIDAMVAQGYVSAAVGAEAKAAPLMPKNVKHEISFGATRVPYFVQYVTQLLVNKYGEKTTFNGGLRVYTTIDLSEQAHAEKDVHNRLKNVAQAGTPISGALVSIDPRDGEVKAMVGGAKYGRDAKKGESTFNIATDGHRQPGSAFKPFVLAAALQKGIQPDTVFVSRKVILQQDDHTFMLVKNDFPVYAGPIDLRSAMTQSDNTVYAQLTQTVHPDAVVNAAHDLGINSPLDPNLSIGLGGVRIGVTPLEMAHAYASLASRGVRVGGSLLFHTPDAGYESPTQDPISILRVDFPNGHHDVNRVKASRAMSETDALTQIDAMRGVTTLQSGTGTAAALPGRTVVGKTGTSSDFKDAWFVGFTPQRVTAVWVGYTNPARSMAHDFHGQPVFGGTYPAEIFHDFMQQALRGQPTADWPHSPGVAQNSYMVDVRRDPYVLAPIGCKGVRELIMAVHDRPTTQTSDCERGLTFVPDLTGLKRAAARSLSDGQGLNFQWEFQAAQPGQQIDRVVDQVPSPGVQVPVGDPVRVFIAKDVPLVRVPAVTGLDITEATARLQAMQFRVVIEDGATQAGARPGEVIGQDVRADAPQPRRSVITLAVVGHSGAIPVPHLRGLTLATARDVMRREGLRIESERQNGGATTRDDDLVVDTDIAAGKLVPKGATVTVLTARRSAR